MSYKMQFAMNQKTVLQKKKKSLLHDILKNSSLYILLLPTLTLLLLFKYYPVAVALYRSLFDWNGGLVSTYVGFDNFINMFRDEIFLTSVKNLMVYVIFLVPLTVVMPFIAAELLVNLKNTKAADFFRNIYISPLVVPGIVTLLLWKFMYIPEIGALNKILEGLGLGALKQNWLGNPDIAIFSVILASMPFIVPFRLLIFIAGLQNIPREIYEFAAIEGASRFVILIKIDIPFSLSQVKLALMLAILNVLEGFDSIFVLTMGGPIDSTINPALYMYKVANQYVQYGYSAAIGLVIFLAVFILTIINNKLIKSPTDFSAT